MDLVPRRTFLEISAAAGAAALLPASSSLARAEDAAPNPFARAMRWGQLAFVENDPGSYDPQFWLDYFRRTHLDAVTLSAGGVVAFYPTRGLDVRSAVAARERLLAARGAGAGILLISEDLDELFTLSDRLVVLFRGRNAGGGRPEALTVEAVGHMMTGTTAPHA